MEGDVDDESLIIDFTLTIQADIFADLAAGFARADSRAAAEMISSIEKRIASELRTQADSFRRRGLSTDGIGQAASFLADTMREAKQKMAGTAKAY
jgi:hypothetical protein